MKYTFDDHAQYQSEMGEGLYPEDIPGDTEATNAVFKMMGLQSEPAKNTVDVGVNFKGQRLYSDLRLANSTDISIGNKTATTSGMALGAMGAFSDVNEASKFVAIGRKAEDQKFLDTLDKIKADKDLNGFFKEIGGDHSTNGFTAYKLYENWNNLSPSQKSLGVASAGMQGFTFDDGKTFKTKKLTPELKDFPALNASQGLKLAGQGVNVSPAVKKWGQFATIQETLYQPGSASDVVDNVNSMGLLGFGMDGRAVPVESAQLAKQGAKPVPQYGIGAMTIPAAQGIPQGYVAVQKFGGNTLIIPKDNTGTVVLNAPEIASKAASSIYGKWSKSAPVKQDKGVIGGSALVGGLDKMTQTNPYTLGAVITVASMRNTPPDSTNYGDLAHSTYLTGISLQRLLTGSTTKDTDIKAKEFITTGEFTSSNYTNAMKQMRSKYAEQGISSKEIGYQLANQGFSEGRFNESEVVGLHRSLDLVFDDESYKLAQKLNTGKDKGVKILEKNRG